MPNSWAVTVWHGESKTLYYLTSHREGDPDDVWTVVKTYRSWERVIEARDRLNAGLTTCDVLVYLDSSLSIVKPQTDGARDWISEHISEDAQWFAGGVVVEPRYLEDVVVGMREDGLVVHPEIEQ